ncbi:hypothetical protein FBU59_004125 [Linderina macrospora]|uniref:Uncharacterized protein n=1 Tax=Linderina macrospora TaxID=4868 RepID=A0ACC1J6L4_9FUNG|nr:hypothetical protein FBU59_004125 [Linderina macrospora]
MSGMHSALKHDAIVSGKDTDVNHERIEAEAERVASGARMALQESRKARRQLDISVPTWTGSSGEAGMPGGKQRFGSKVNPNLVAPPPSILMSNELPDEFKFGGLQALGGSRPRNLPPAASAINDSIVQNAVTMELILVEAIRKALKDAGGEMGSRELIERFERQVPTGGAARLRELAASVADLASRQPQGARRTGIGRVVHKVWVLKGN